MGTEPLVHVVEDDDAMRDALRMLLRGAGFNVRCHESAEDFLGAFDPMLPLCVVTDVRLPGMDGLALHRHLVSRGLEPAVVMITGHGDVPMAVAALKCGVSDFVEKPFDPGVLLDSIQEAVRRAAEGSARRIVTTEIRNRLLELTYREREVLDLMVEGQPNKVIATRLGISVRTAEHHRAHIMEKMQARSLSQVIRTMLELPRPPN
ncbi:MAG: response regulator transcription factor [Acetobacteraceae bacterium]